MTTTCDDVMAELESLGDAAVFKRNAKNGAGENQFGVKLGDLRKVAKRIKSNPELAFELWATGNMDAQLLAILLLEPKKLTREQLETLVTEGTIPQVADWVNSYVVKHHPEKEACRETWMNADDPMLQRAGWSLTGGRLQRDADGLDIPAILDRIEAEGADADEAAQWTMNFALIYAGTHHADHRERAIAIGEKLGMFRDYPTSKGCVSPFAPIAIPEMVKRLP